MQTPERLSGASAGIRYIRQKNNRHARLLERKDIKYMQMKLCSRCKKRVAVVYVTKTENGQTTSEGLCLRCAKERQNRQAELLGKMRVPALHYSVLRRRARKICDIEDSFRKILSIIANFAQTMIFLAKFYAETSILDNVQQQPCRSLKRKRIFIGTALRRPALPATPYE